MRNNAFYCSSVCSPAALYNQEGSVITKKKKKKKQAKINKKKSFL